MAKQLLKHRVDFSVKGKIEGMDGLPKIKGQTNCRIFQEKKILKLRTDWL